MDSYSETVIPRSVRREIINNITITKKPDTSERTVNMKRAVGK